MLTAVPHAKVNSCIGSIFAQKLCVPGDDCEADAPVTVNPDYSSAVRYFDCVLTQLAWSQRSREQLPLLLNATVLLSKKG